MKFLSRIKRRLAWMRDAIRPSKTKAQKADPTPRNYSTLLDGWITKVIVGLLYFLGLLWCFPVVLIVWRSFSGPEIMWIDSLFGTSGLTTTVKWETIKTISRSLFDLLLLVSTIIGTIIGTIAGAIIVYRMTRASEETAQPQHDTNEQKMFKATTKLGHQSGSVRLRGIDDLHKLAGLNKDYLTKIAEILCTYLRETTQKKSYQKKYKDKPSNEIQYLVKVLSTLNTELSVLNSRKEKNGNFDFLRLDLSASYLVGVNLTNACLKYVNLTETNLMRASLDGGQMQKAHLIRAQMQNTHCNEVQLQGAFLHEAQMQRASLWRAQMQMAILNQAQMQGAILHETQLQGTTLIKTQMQGVELWAVQLQGAKLWAVQLQGAKLWTAQLQGATLNEVDLRGAYGSSSVEHLNLPEWIRKRQDKQTDLTTVIFKGGLRQEDAWRIRKQLTECQKKWMDNERGCG